MQVLTGWGLGLGLGLGSGSWFALSLSALGFYDFKRIENFDVAEHWNIWSMNGIKCSHY